MIGDHITDSNPIALGPTLGDMMFPYMRGVSAIVPTFARGPAELFTNKDFFTEAELTPYWIKQGTPAEEQVKPNTSEVARLLFSSMKGAFQMAGIGNPIELEQLANSYTGGKARYWLQTLDELTALKDHPGIQPGILSPLISGFGSRFRGQTPHGNSRTVQDLYDRRDELEQIANPSFQQASELSAINSATQQMSAIRKAAQAKQITREEADRQQFQIANRILRKIR
jgi:hypothetical protein